MRISVAHLYPDYLNIYADRGNIAVLARRAALRGHELDVHPVGLGYPLLADDYDLLYVGGGQDREQALVAPDLAAKSEAIHAAQAGGVAMLAVCGGYQLLGRGYLARDGSFMPGVGLFAHETVAGTTRMIGDVLLECELEPGVKHPLAGFENHAGRTLLDDGASLWAGWSSVSGTTESPGSKALGSATRSGPTSTGRSCREIRGSQTGFSRARSRMRRPVRRRSSRRSRTSSKQRRFALLPSGPEAAAADARSGFHVGHPSPPPAFSVTAKCLRVVHEVRRDSAESGLYGTHISPR